MSLSWFQRKTRLASLLKSRGDEDADGLAMDRILHGQSVIGKTSKTTEIDAIRFQDKDLVNVGTLDYGQFGVIDVVTCRLDGRVYVRKSIEKRFALRTRDQCSPQFERDLLLQAFKTDSQWAPHLLCAFQTHTHLNLVMDYAEGGTLWDVLESSPHDGKVPEADLMWWTPQIVSAIHWCHSQGFAHRDIKPHNFVLTPNAHVLLIDFGSAAPLLPPGPDGSQLIPKRYCLVPCGTCDYISPEILKAHEEALVALELEDDDGLQPLHIEEDTLGYGRETDWWSLGAMLYEMAFGVAPFFAKDIKQTYLRVMDHERSLRFDRTASVSLAYQSFLGRILTRAEHRLGRRSISEITEHPIFESVNWNTLPTQTAPPNLHLPKFTYTEPANIGPDSATASLQPHHDYTHSQGFAFSALFQSSHGSSSPGLSILRSRSSPFPTRSLDEDATASFIGFSWGPPLEIFPSEGPEEALDIQGHSPAGLDTPRPLRVPITHITPIPALVTPQWLLSTPIVRNAYSTPIRPGGMTPHQTLPRTSTIRRTTMRRTVSDREAMKQLVDCIGMSARKKVLESGRKPRVLVSFDRSGTLKKELRFLPTPTPPVSDYAASSSSHGRARSKPKPITVNPVSSGSEDTDTECPPSPSPSPRPGSAMSMISRRSGTPTISSLRTGMGTISGTSTLLLPGSRSMSFSRSGDLSLSEASLIEAPLYNDMEDRLASLAQKIRDMEAELAQLSMLIR